MKSEPNEICNNSSYTKNQMKQGVCQIIFRQAFLSANNYVIN